MTMIPEKAVEWYRKNNPVDASVMSDNAIYKYLQLEHPDLEWPSENPFLDKTPSYQEIQAKHKPGEQGLLSKAFLANPVAEAWANTDWWGSDFARKAYNDSMAGMAYQMMYGAPKYEVKSEENMWMEEIPQFFVGMLNPIDIMSLWGGGKASQFALASWKKGLGKQTLKYVDDYALAGTRKAIDANKAISRTSAAGKNYAIQAAVDGAIGAGTNLATYTSAASFLSREAQQRLDLREGRISEEEYSLWNSVYGAITDGINSGLIGAMSGGIIKGKMMPALAKASSIKNPTFAQSVKKALVSPAAQFGAEAGIFTTGHIATELMHGEKLMMKKQYDENGQVIKDEHGNPILEEGFNWELLGSSLGHNLGIIGGFRVLGKAGLMGKHSSVKDQVKAHNNAVKEIVRQIKYEAKPERYYKAKYVKQATDSDGNPALVSKNPLKDFPSYHEAIAESLAARRLRDIAKNLKKQGLDEPAKEMDNEAATKEQEVDAMLEAKDVTVQLYERLSKIQKKLDEGATFNDLTAQEHLDMLVGTSTVIGSAINTYSHFVNNKDAAYRHFAKDIANKKYKELTDADKKLIDAHVEGTHDMLISNKNNWNNFFKPENQIDLAQAFVNQLEIKIIKNKDKTFRLEVNDKTTKEKFPIDLKFETNENATAARDSILDILNVGPKGSMSGNKVAYHAQRNGKDITVEGKDTVFDTSTGQYGKETLPDIRVTDKANIKDIIKKGEGRYLTDKEVTGLKPDIFSNSQNNSTIINNGLNTAVNTIIGAAKQVKTGAVSFDTIKENLLNQGIITSKTNKKGQEILEIDLKAVKSNEPKAYNNLKRLQENKEIGQNDKVIIANFMLKNQRGSKSSKGLSLAIELTKFTRKKYKKGLHELDDIELQSLITDYSLKVTKEKYGKEYDIFGQSAEALKKQTKGDKSLEIELATLANKIHDSAKEIFLSKFNPSAKRYYSKDQLDSIFDTLGTRYGATKTTGKEIVFSDGKKAQKKFATAILKGDILKKHGGNPNTILGKDKEIIDALFELSFAKGLRPNEVANILLEHISSDGIIIPRAKGGKTESWQTPEAKKIAKKILAYAKKNNITNLKERVFPFANANAYNKYVEALSKRAGAEIVTYNIATGEQTPGAKGMQAGYAIRKQYEGMDVAEINKKIGTGVGAKYKSGVVKKVRAAGRTAREVLFDEFRTESSKLLEDAKKRNKLTDEQLKEVDLNNDAVGEFGNGQIRVQKGEWQPSDLFHELYHRFKAVGRLSKDKKINNLVDKAESLAKNTKEYKEWKSKEANKNRDFEEFLADVTGEKASVLYANKGIVSKIGQIAKQLMSRVKKFFGVANFNDYTRLISARIEKGVIAPEGLKYTAETKFKTLPKESIKTKETTELQRNKSRGMLETISIKAKEQGVTPEQFMKRISIESGIENMYSDLVSFAAGTKRELSDFQIGKIQDLYDFVSSPKFDRIKFDIKTSEEAYQKSLEISSLEKQKGVSDSASIRMLTLLGVQNGIKSNASIKQLKRYEEVLRLKEDMMTAENHVQRQEEVNALENVIKDVPSWTKVLEVFGKEIELPMPLPNPEYIKQSFFMWAAPVGETLKSVGLNKLAERVDRHLSRKHHYESYHEVFKNRIEQLGVSKRDWDGGSSLQKNSRGYKGSMWAINGLQEGYAIQYMYKYLKDARISKTQKRTYQEGLDFLEKVANKEFFKTIDKTKFKAANIRTKKDGVYIYLNKTGKVDAKTNPNGYSKEAQLAIEYWNMMDSYMGFTQNTTSAKGIIRAIRNIPGITEAEVNTFIQNFKDGAIKRVKDGYFPRVFTEDAKGMINPGSKAVKAEIKKLTEKYAIEEARRRYKNFDNVTDKVQQDMIKGRGKYKSEHTPWFVGEQTAHIEFQRSIQFRTTKLSFKNFKKRTMLFDAMMEKDGQLVETYKLNYHETVDPYVLGVSTFLANVEIFPEKVKVDGLKWKPTEDLITEGQFGSGERGRTIEKYVKDSIDRIVGDTKYEPSYTNTLLKGLEGYSRFLAKTLLSFPTAAAKNLGTGTSQTFAAFKFADVQKGMMDAIRRESSKELKFERLSAVKQELGIYEGPGTASKYLDRYAFKFGFMGPSEKFNRRTVVYASLYDQARQIKRLQTYEKTDAKYKKAEKRLKDFYELNDKEISLLKKHGSSESIASKEFKDVQLKMELQNIENHLNTMAHVKTQGTTADAYMPGWASNRFFKPALLFKRMAYAATVNTTKNFKIAAKHGNYSRIFVSLLSTYATGLALQGIFNKLLFDSDMPDQNSPWYIRTKNLLFRGELLGFGGQMINTLFGGGYGRGIESEFIPAYWNHGKLTINQVYKVATRKSFLGKGMNDGQAIDTWIKGTFSAYNNTMKIIERRNNPMGTTGRNHSKLYEEFEKEMTEKGISVSDISFESSTRSPYYKDLKNAFYKGTPEEFSKHYLLTYNMLTADYIRTHKASNISEARKLALKEMDTQLERLNPNYGFTTAPKKTQKAKIRDLSLFIKWIKRQKPGILFDSPEQIIREMVKNEQIYRDKLKVYKKQLPYYVRKYNLGGEKYSNFDFTPISFKYWK